jgi:hypothetical protein
VNTWKVILATMVIFAAGVVTGGLLVRHVDDQYLARRRPSQNPRGNQAFSPVGMRVEFLRRAQRDLNLSAEQRERVDKIIKESQERTRSQVRDELQRTRTEFREVLTAEQQARFDELVKRQQQHPREQRRPTSAAPSGSPPD